MSIQDKRKNWQADAQRRRKRLDDAIATGDASLEQVRILRDVIDPRALADEPELAKSRWPEYGYLSAVEATAKFAKEYVRIYGSIRRQYVDGKPHRCPVDEDFVLNDPGTMNALYRARQFADALGLPYDRFIRGMMQRLIGVGRYRRVPLPNHLCPPVKSRTRKGRKAFVSKSGEVVAQKALRHGLAVQADQLPRTRLMGPDWDERFMARNYVGDPAQERALRALVDHPQAESTARSRLRNRLQQGWISVDNARRLFPAEVVDRALADTGALPAPGEPDPGLVPYEPHCMGLIQADGPAPECGDCLWQGGCRSLASRAEDAQQKLSGYANRADRERQEATERKQAQRARNNGRAAADRNVGGDPDN